MTTPLWLSGSLRPFFVQFFCIFFHLFLISSAYVRSLPFLSCIVPIFAWNISLISVILLKRSLVFPILLFSFISLHCSLKNAFLPLLAILWNSAFSWIYLSLSPLPFASLLFQIFVRPPQKTTWPSAFIFIRDGFGHNLLYSVTNFNHSSSGTLSTKSKPLNLFVTSTVPSWRIWFRSYLSSLGIFPNFFSLSLNFAY